MTIEIFPVNLTPLPPGWAWIPGQPGKATCMSEKCEAYRDLLDLWDWFEFNRLRIKYPQD